MNILSYKEFINCVIDELGCGFDFQADKFYSFDAIGRWGSILYDTGKISICIDDVGCDGILYNERYYHYLGEFKDKEDFIKKLGFVKIIQNELSDMSFEAKACLDFKEFVSMKECEFTKSQG